LRWPNAAIADDIHLHLVTGPDPFDLCLNRTGVGINKNCHCPNVPVALLCGDRERRSKRRVSVDEKDRIFRLRVLKVQPTAEMRVSACVKRFPASERVF